MDGSSYAHHAAKRQLRSPWAVEHSNEAESDARLFGELGGYGERRTKITRINRACNACRRAKIRCIGGDNPPCERCLSSSQECVVEKPPTRIEESGINDRVRSLENHMGVMQDSLDQIVQLLQTGPTASISPSSATPHSNNTRSETVMPFVEQPEAHPSNIPRTSSTLPMSSAPVRSIEPSFAHPEATSFRPVKALSASLPPSRASPEPGDVLKLLDINNPLGDMSTMAEKVEKAVQKQGPSSKPFRNFESANFTINAHASGRARSPQMLDAIDEGLISEDEGRELVKIFFSGPVEFANCFDPKVNDFDLLRSQSALAITAVMMVGARVRDGGETTSPAQRACLEHAEKIASDSLLHPATKVEDVQGLILLAAYTDGRNSWLMAGHAVRTAIDIGINRAFVRLLRGGMGEGKSLEELESERSLVMQARIWFAVYRLEHQMSFGLGRPAILGEDETIQNCWRLLDHPLAIKGDARLLFAVDLMSIRGPLHTRITATPDLPIDPATLEQLKSADKAFNTWQQFWEGVLSDRYGLGPHTFERESLSNMRHLNELFVYSQLLRGVHEISDVKSMPDERKAYALKAMTNAQHCMQYYLNSQTYSSMLRFGTHYTHVCAAYVGTFLIRTARLFPQHLNVKETATNVAKLADILASAPAGRYARSLRLILQRARRANVIPPLSRAPSPPPQLPRPPSLSATLSSDPPAGASVFLTDDLTFDSLDWDLSAALSSLEQAGITLDQDSSLPLFLDGCSLGANVGPSDDTSFVGLEEYFLPQELDDILATMGSDNVNRSGS